jgi:Tfp pilus assembly protein FimV
MPPPSLGRYLAPLALVAVLVTTIAVIATVNSGGGGQQAKGNDTKLSQAERRRRRARRQARAARTTYTVRQGDTIDVIAQRTRVAKDQIVRLNPSIDPQALQPGQQIKLR